VRSRSRERAGDEPFVRIAHFSDLHVLSLAGVGPLRFLNKRLVGYLNLRFKRHHIHRTAYVRAIAREVRRAGVDHVAVTGDLTNLALEPEFEAVRELLEDDLGLPPSSVSVVPGNHDLYTRGAMRGKRFVRYMGAYVESDLDVATPGDLGVFPFVRLRGPLAIVGLSSAVPRPPFMAAGKLGDAQLDALSRLLALPEVAARTPVILLHHPIHAPRSRVKAALEGLHDARELGRRLAGVEHGLLLHGHLHRRLRQVMTTDRGELQSIGATSASLHHDLDTRMAGFNLYEFDDAGRLVGTEAHVLTPDDRFRVEPVPLGEWT
jgi:3',5'-cyclic AMP phosphodiesterase CpdA